VRKQPFSRQLAILIVFLLISTGFLMLGTSQASAQPSGSPSEVLLGSGAKWAANGGTQALYVDSYDTWVSHSGTDGVYWSWWPLDTRLTEKSSISGALSEAGLNVTVAGDIPLDLSRYDVVVIASVFACTPSDSIIIRNYIAGGGGVVLYAGVPEYFRSYIKGNGGYGNPTDPLSVNNSDWLGFTGYVNTGGQATITLDRPFGTEFISGDQVIDNNGQGNAAVTGANGSIIAMWQYGNVFACSHEFGQGRLYYQAGLDYTLTEKIAPYSLSATPKDTSVALTWKVPTPVQGTPVDYYVIYQDGVDIAHVNDNAVVVGGLTNGHSYSFAVAAHNTSGIGPLSENATATPNPIPPAPLGLTLVSSMNSVNLRWEASLLATSYCVYSGSGEDSMKLIGISSTTLYNDTNVSRGSTYYYSVSATNSIGEGARSIVGNVTTLTLMNGTIVDVNGIPLSGITITLENGSSTRTDDNGGYSFAVYPGAHKLTINGSGIQTMSVPVSVYDQGSTISVITSNSDNGLDFPTIILIVISIALSIIAIMVVAMYVRRKWSG
jgi:hypothetical protein